MTILVPKSGAQSYLEESMLVVAAAGMAASVPVWWTPSAHYLILDSQHIKHRMLSAVIENQFKTNGTVPKSAAVVIGNRVFFAPLSPNHICNTFADPFTFICMSFILIPPPHQHNMGDVSLQSKNICFNKCENVAAANEQNLRTAVICRFVCFY